jgi:hypothetical protein
VNPRASYLPGCVSTSLPALGCLSLVAVDCPPPGGVPRSLSGWRARRSTCQLPLYSFPTAPAGQEHPASGVRGSLQPAGDELGHGSWTQ